MSKQIFLVTQEPAEVSETLAEGWTVAQYQALAAIGEGGRDIHYFVLNPPEPDETQATELREKLDEARQEIPRWCKLYEKVRISSSIVEKERDNLHDFVRSFLTIVEQNSDGNFVMLTDDIDPLARLAVLLVETGE